MSTTAPRDEARRAAGEDSPSDRPTLSRELISQALGHIRELHERKAPPNEGLRERKKRLTRQAISDTATWMFCERGFDQVRVAEVAAEAGVSEKTVFNYFPTKESLVFDREEAVKAGVRRALLHGAPGASPTQAMVAFVEQECVHLDELDEAFLPLFLAFVRLIEETPALQTARQELMGRLATVAREALAERLGLDPRDPEPYVAAQALITLWDLQVSVRERHIEAGVPLSRLRRAVLADVHRAARLLDDGLGTLSGAAREATDRPPAADSPAAE